MKNRVSNIGKTALAAFLIAFMVSASSYAKPQRPKGPPPEAKEACVDKAEGDEVSFETRKGDTITGHCQLIEDELVAVPDDHEHKEERPSQ